MLDVLRITLMWLVALAVPVQGYAAAAMFGCGPGHHSMTSTSQAAAAEDHDAAGPQPSNEARVEVAANHHDDDSAEPNHAHKLEARGTPDKVGKGSCTPCASCCVVTALPATMLVFQPVPLVDFFVPLARRGLASFLTEGPERPPRFILV